MSPRYSRCEVNSFRALTSSHFSFFVGVEGHWSDFEHGWCVTPNYTLGIANIPLSGIVLLEFLNACSQSRFCFIFFFYIVILVDLSVFNSLCILKFKYYKNEASIFGEGEWHCFLFCLFFLWISQMVQTLFLDGLLWTVNSLVLNVLDFCWKTVTHHCCILHKRLSVTWLGNCNVFTVYQDMTAEG